MINTTRREFLVNSAMVIGGTIGGLTLGSRLLTPKTARAAKIDFPEPSCEAKTWAGKKIRGGLCQLLRIHRRRGGDDRSGVMHPRCPFIRSVFHLNHIDQ